MMTTEQIKATFAAFDPNHPFYLACLQLLDDAITTEQGDVTLPCLADGARHFNAGRLAQAKDFRGYFSDVMNAALAEAAEARLRAERQAG
jgi:hypothetical protein